MSDDTPPPPGDPPVTPDSDSTTAVETLLAELSTLQSASGEDAVAREARDVERLLAAAGERGLVATEARDFQLRDAAEAFVGSVIFASPLLVEDGIFDIAAHLFEVTVGGLPVFLIANTVFVVVMTYALMEWTGRTTEETRLLPGGIPLRLVTTLVISFVVATVLMTVWGRVGDWQTPTQALSRITVLWTVGSLGAALGDIVSEGEPTVSVQSVADTPPEDRLRTDGAGERAPDPTALRQMSDAAVVEELAAQFEDLEAAVDSPEHRRDVERLKEGAIAATLGDTFGDEIRKYTPRDIAEAFVGSIFFAIPLLVEDGVFDVAGYFLSIRVGLFPVSFLANAAFVLLMVSALVYWAGPQNVRVYRPIFGLIPRRLVGITVVSFLTAAMLMTMWGRVDGWADPVVAVARISVVWTVASFGAALGDILPGESSGADINDELAGLGENPQRATGGPD